MKDRIIRNAEADLAVLREYAKSKQALIDEPVIEMRTYALPAQPFNEFFGVLRWYVAGWVPTYEISESAGVSQSDYGDAVPFSIEKFEFRRA